VRSIVGRMRNRHHAVVGALVAIVVWVAPTAGQGGASPSPSVAPAVSPGASLPAVSPSTPARRGPHWTAVKDRDVTRSGILGHAVSLGDEVIALAPFSDRHGQSSVRVLATGDGASWSRRGTIRLTGAVTDLLADGTSLFAVGWDQGATIWRSDDAGATWATPADAASFLGGADGRPGADDAAQVQAIARGPAGLVAVGDATDPDTLARRAAVWRSADGLSWERVAEAGALPPFHAIAADAATYVVVGSTIGAPTSPPGADVSMLRWSTDGLTWTDATAEIAAMEVVTGVITIPGNGFLAWGSRIDGPTPLAIVWTSTDGRTWQRLPDDPALAGADLVSVRSLEGGALTMAVGGTPTGAYAWPWLGTAWRRDAIRVRAGQCISDVASVKAILVAVGGTCTAARPHGRAWTTPLEP